MYKVDDIFFHFLRVYFFWWFCSFVGSIFFWYENNYFFFVFSVEYKILFLQKKFYGQKYLLVCLATEALPEFIAHWSRFLKKTSAFTVHTGPDVVIKTSVFTVHNGRVRTFYKN